MSAPPLPEFFGNPTLGDFVEVVSPMSISWLPQTAGWAWLGAIIGLLLLRLGWRRLRHWYRNRYRREAISRLNALGSSTDSGSEAGNWLVELNKLLKITALAGFSREDVARLSGQEWTSFLNAQCAEPPFSPEQLELLAVGIYRNNTPGKETRKQLLEASLAWVQTHGNPADA